MDNRRRIVPRAEWGARYGRGNDVSHLMPWGEVVFHTEAGAIRPQDWEALAGYSNGALEAAVREVGKMRAVENFHVNTRGWNGIAYSFFIAFDGTVYEGRGWGRSGAHTEGRNSTACGVCFEGHGDLQPLTDAQIESARWLVAEGKRLRMLKATVKISGHRNYSTKGKTCPGNLVYPIIQSLGTPLAANPGELTMSEATAIRKEMQAMESRLSRQISDLANGTKLVTEHSRRSIQTVANAATLLLEHNASQDAETRRQVDQLRADLEELR